MAIHVWSYLREYEAEKEETLAAIERVLSSGRLILGPSVEHFENEFSKWCNVSYGVGVNSGTDAVFLALKALEIGPGDEVITVSNTAVPTVAAIVLTGATPRFVDIDPETYLMNVDALENVRTGKTKAIIPVHLFGQCVDMTRLHAYAKQHHLFVVEDCAQAHGARHRGKIAGSMSDVAAFSFYPTKILGGYGDGGMVVTQRENIAQKLKRLRFYGMEKTYYSKEYGINSRLDEIHAEILRVKLKHIDSYISRRQEIASLYDEELKTTPLVRPKIAQGNIHAYYLYVCRHPQRDVLIEELKKREIFVNISYPWPIHMMDAYRYLGVPEGSLPETEKAAREIFSLPMFPTLSDNEVRTVCRALKEIFDLQPRSERAPQAHA